MKIGSLFSGAGGGDHGFKQSGHEIIFGAEINPFARSVFRYHNNTSKIYHDVKEITISKIREDNIEIPDVIFGRSPCQDLSIAKKNRQ